MSYLYSNAPINAHQSLGALINDALFLNKPLIVGGTPPNISIPSSSPINPCQPNECKNKNALAYVVSWA